MDVNPMVSKSEIGHFQLGKGPSRGLLRDCEIFVNLRITFVWSWIINCHLHSCLRPWCGLEERIWWNHEYEFEESRSRQTLLTGLDRDRQLASGTSGTSAPALFISYSAMCSPAPARPSPCRNIKINPIFSSMDWRAQASYEKCIYSNCQWPQCIYTNSQ